MPEQAKKPQKILKPLSSEEALAAANRASLAYPGSPNPELHAFALKNGPKFVKIKRAKKRNQKKGLGKPKTYEEDYNELLNDLAEARNAANQLRSERFKDDSSPFNPELSENEAYNIIKKATKKPQKILKPLSSEEAHLARNRASLAYPGSPNPRLHALALKNGPKFQRKVS